MVRCGGTQRWDIKRWASRFAVDRIAPAVIQASKPEPRIMRYELTDYEWAAIWPFPARLLLREYWFYPIGLLVGFAIIMIVEFWYWQYDGKKRERKNH
jgi:hypothetical protein